MIEKLFSSIVRNDIIDETCSNLIVAGLICPKEAGKYMAAITNESDTVLAETLVDSRMLLDAYYLKDATSRRN